MQDVQRQEEVAQAEQVAEVASLQADAIAADIERAEGLRCQLRESALTSISDALREGNLSAEGVWDGKRRLVHVSQHQSFWGRAAPWEEEGAIHDRKGVVQVGRPALFEPR